jgi:hypothetical protein
VVARKIPENQAFAELSTYAYPAGTPIAKERDVATYDEDTKRERK